MLQADIWLYGLGIFCTPVFGLDLRLTIVICGLVVVFVFAAGGSWAVVAGDFLQALVLVPITIVAAFTANLPDAHWQLVRAAEGFGPWWILAVALEKLTHINGLHSSSRYLCAVDGREARKAGLLSSLLFFVGSIVWFIPPLVARAQGLTFDVSSGVANPAEMSYITIAAQSLPAGLLGLLVTGIISSTMSSMDSGLNRNAGIFVRSFYLPSRTPARFRTCTRTGGQTHHLELRRNGHPHGNLLLVVARLGGVQPHDEFQRVGGHSLHRAPVLVRVGAPFS
ncbi:MAG: hypothetical protein J6386_03785 [Candidatus Synoicihabitans palmerolidicus]|nr:hypothetical protein [Candidatus Synoicihabitans palmerolidicus]